MGPVEGDNGQATTVTLGARRIALCFLSTKKSNVGIP